MKYSSCSFTKTLNEKLKGVLHCRPIFCQIFLKMAVLCSVVVYTTVVFSLHLEEVEGKNKGNTLV